MIRHAASLEKRLKIDAFCELKKPPEKSFLDWFVFSYNERSPVVMWTLVNKFAPVSSSLCAYHKPYSNIGVMFTNVHITGGPHIPIEWSWMIPAFGPGLRQMELPGAAWWLRVDAWANRRGHGMVNPLRLRLVQGWQHVCKVGEHNSTESVGFVAVSGQNWYRQ